MASSHPKRTLPRRNAWVSFLATLKMARWQTRQTIRLLLITGIGIVLAAVLLCTVPLYSQVAISAGIRDALNTTPQGPYILVSSISQQVAPAPINQVQQAITQEFQNDMGSLVSSTPQLSIQAPDLRILASPRTTLKKGSMLNLIGASMNQAAPHLTLLAGRLPRVTANSNELEIALVAETARTLNATIGSTLAVQAFAGNIPPSQASARNLTMLVVGIFKLRSGNDPYWHQEDFQMAQAAGVPPPPPIFKALVSNDALIQAFNLGSSSNAARNALFLNGELNYIAPPELFWWYPLNTSHIDISNLDELVAGMNTALTHISNNPVDPPYVQQTQGVGPYSTLLTYRNYVFVLLIPATALIALLMGLALYFVSVMTDLLVERKSESIAILRSRGANRSQVFGLFVAQATGLSLVGLIAGPLLAIGAVRLLVQNTLSPADQGAINILALEPGQVALQLLEYALVAVFVALLAMIIAIYRATRSDIVTLRRESARTTRAPFWQRTGLDIIAAIIALVGYAATIYVTNPNVLSARTRALLLSPMTLVGAVFLLIGATLLFLRGFPLLLQLGSWLALRGKGASPTLALAQLARSPQQAVRTTMLLAFATAFVIFALVFDASQTQRIKDVAAYQVGSDFGGDISSASANVPSSTFSQLPGVISATTGYTSSESVIGISDVSVELRAVDARTYAQTAIWTDQDSSQPLSSLMRQLLAANSSEAGYVPAIVDAAAWNTMHLSVGSHFALSDLNGQVNFVAIAEVQHIPTVDDTTEVNDTGDYIPAGGVLVDFQTYDNLSMQVNSIPLITSYIWLKTKDDPASVQEVRSELLNAPIPVNNIVDRRAIIASLQQDPLYLAVLEMLVTGAVAALLLALIGNLIASWQNARSRLTSFSVLRALGSSRQQLASVLLWEQSIVYATSLILGILFGIFLSLLALPTLIFTSLGGGASVSTGEFYVIQSVPPIRVVIPSTLWIALAILIVVCIIAIWMMVRIVSRPSISQTLRLSED